MPAKLDLWQPWWYPALTPWGLHSHQKWQQYVLQLSMKAALPEGRCSLLLLPTLACHLCLNLLGVRWSQEDFICLPPQASCCWLHCTKCALVPDCPSSWVFLLYCKVYIHPNHPWTCTIPLMPVQLHSQTHWIEHWNHERINNSKPAVKSKISWVIFLSKTKSLLCSQGCTLTAEYWRAMPGQRADTCQMSLYVLWNADKSKIHTIII